MTRWDAEQLVWATEKIIRAVGVFSTLLTRFVLRQSCCRDRDGGCCCRRDRRFCGACEVGIFVFTMHISAGAAGALPLVFCVRADVISRAAAVVSFHTER